MEQKSHELIISRPNLTLIVERVNSCYFWQKHFRKRVDANPYHFENSLFFLDFSIFQIHIMNPIPRSPFYKLNKISLFLAKIPLSYLRDFEYYIIFKNYRIKI